MARKKTRRRKKIGRGPRTRGITNTAVGAFKNTPVGAHIKGAADIARAIHAADQAAAAGPARTRTIFDTENREPLVPHRRVLEHVPFGWIPLETFEHLFDKWKKSKSVTQEDVTSEVEAAENPAENPDSSMFSNEDMELLWNNNCDLSCKKSTKDISDQFNISYPTQLKAKKACFQNCIDDKYREELFKIEKEKKQRDLWRIAKNDLDEKIIRLGQELGTEKELRDAWKFIPTYGEKRTLAKKKLDNFLLKKKELETDFENRLKKEIKEIKTRMKVEKQKKMKAQKHWKIGIDKVQKQRQASRDAVEAEKRLEEEEAYLEEVRVFNSWFDTLTAKEVDTLRLQCPTDATMDEMVEFIERRRKARLKRAARRYLQKGVVRRLRKQVADHRQRKQKEAAERLEELRKKYKATRTFKNHFLKRVNKLGRRVRSMGRRLKHYGKRPVFELVAGLPLRLAGLHTGRDARIEEEKRRLKKEDKEEEERDFKRWLKTQGVGQMGGFKSKRRRRRRRLKRKTRRRHNRH